MTMSDDVPETLEDIEYVHSALLLLLVSEMFSLYQHLDMAHAVL